MQQLHLKSMGLALGLLIFTAIPASAQPPARFLTLAPPDGLPIIPFMEGWFANDDGSVVISFGYDNRNKEPVEIPLGEANYLEPEQFNGMQPSYFEVGRHQGVYAVILPEAARDDDVWWHIKTGKNEIVKVPGRYGSNAYELDRNPRPQGSVQPEGWFEEGGEVGTGIEGLMADSGKTVAVGEPLTLTVYGNDPSVRDPSDPRFKEPLSLHMTWVKHQGPGTVEFTRHESTPEPEVREIRGRTLPPLPDSTVELKEGKGTGMVIATFSAPGEYLIRTRLDNWRAPDSAGADQCCWTNLYQKVNVTP